MKTNNNRARKHRSPVASKLLNQTTPVEKMQTKTKMTLAARLDDLIMARGWGKGEFAEKVNKNRSEISKWLSGTHNFTIDTLAEIAVAFDMSVAELLTTKRMQVVNKAKIVVKVEGVQPALTYYTPLGDENFASDGYCIEVNADMDVLLNTGIPA